MNHINKTLIHQLALCLICLLPLTSVWSADEDMISQVYLEFDPETGEFKTALDPMAQQKNEHMQAQQIQEIQQNQDTLADQQDGSTQQASVAAAPATGQQSNTATGSGNSMMIIGGIVALLLVVGVVVVMRKNQQTA